MIKIDYRSSQSAANNIVGSQSNRKKEAKRIISIH